LNFRDWFQFGICLQASASPVLDRMLEMEKEKQRRKGKSKTITAPKIRILGVPHDAVVAFVRSLQTMLVFYWSHYSVIVTKWNWIELNCILTKWRSQTWGFSDINLINHIFNNKYYLIKILIMLNDSVWLEVLLYKLFRLVHLYKDTTVAYYLLFFSYFYIFLFFSYFSKENNVSWSYVL
jgi:hypothetical protein